MFSRCCNTFFFRCCSSFSPDVFALDVCQGGGEARLVAGTDPCVWGWEAGARAALAATTGKKERRETPFFRGSRMRRLVSAPSSDGFYPIRHPGASNARKKDPIEFPCMVLGWWKISSIVGPSYLVRYYGEVPSESPQVPWDRVSQVGTFQMGPRSGGGPKCLVLTGGPCGLWL